jgi:hypothetical protein
LQPPLKRSPQHFTLNGYQNPPSLFKERRRSDF